MAMAPEQREAPPSVPFTTAAAPHYTSPAPNTVMETHHHLNEPTAHGEMPVGPYMGDANFDTPAQSLSRPPAARRGPFKDQNDRQKTAQTRKDGSCIRCRMQRIRISDVVLSKTSQVKGHEWTLRWKDNTVLDDVGHWASSEIRIVRITEGYTNEYVELRVRKFIPQDGDSLDRSWVTPDGKSRSVRIPPYAVIEPEAIAPQYSTYIKKGLVACCTNVLSDQKHTLLWPTYWIAINMSRSQNNLSEKENFLLSNTLDLWMTVRLTTRSFEIVGQETLDMPTDILDETSPSYGKIPIPPVMGAQLDSVLIHQIQHSLKRNVLEGLHRMVTDNKTRTWLTTYLVTFILLHNAALVIKHDASYARKHGMKRRFAREDKVQQYYTGAITLLAYFHYCNKGVFPFTESAREQDIRNLANLDGESMQFVQFTRKYAIANTSFLK
ncbi:hypothetical protein SBRCBS47491_000001 [Sporothrix bragantina]|uniref:PiggyBac transposable element-derived protein domain-containing protein n=1 Tax=Sporothrix bragantina TaxID=671064 RepID=A0ABP0AJZ9_9PEZI